MLTTALVALVSQLLRPAMRNSNHRNSTVWTAGHLGSTINQFVPGTDTLCSQQQKIVNAFREILD